MTRGGKRAGAGRPPLKVRRVDITLTDAQIDWLKSQGNASETIRKMVEDKMDESQKLYEAAKARMIGMEFTDEQMEFIFADWPEGDAHYRWLLVAHREEIIDWIEAAK